MDLFNNIRNRFPRIEENSNMFKLLIILRSKNRKNFGKLSMEIFFNIAEYLFFDEYMAEKLYLIKLYKIYHINEFGNFDSTITNEILSAPIEKFSFVNKIDENGKVKSILLPSTFRRYAKLPDKTNYINATIVIKRENIFSINNSHFFTFEYLERILSYREQISSFLRRERRLNLLYRQFDEQRQREFEEQILYYLRRSNRDNLLLLRLEVQRQLGLEVQRQLGLEEQRQRKLEQQRQRELEQQRQRELEEQLNVTNLKIKEKKKFLNYKKKNQIKNHNLIIKGRYRKKKNRKW